MDIYRELSLRSDAEAQQVLNRMVKGAGALDPALAALVASEGEMKAFVASIKPDAARGIDLLSLGQDPRGVRVTLVLAAEDTELRPALEASLAQARHTREPLTIALVLAGIVLILSTNFEVSYEASGDSRKFSFKIKKEATSPEILKKFFGLFGGG
jgi:hypothetical protein